MRITPLLRQLYWLKATERIDFKLAVLVLIKYDNIFVVAYFLFQLNMNTVPALIRPIQQAVDSHLYKSTNMCENIILPACVTYFWHGWVQMKKLITISLYHLFGLNKHRYKHITWYVHTHYIHTHTHTHTHREIRKQCPTMSRIAISYGLLCVTYTAFRVSPNSLDWLKVKCLYYMI